MPLIQRYLENPESMVEKESIYPLGLQRNPFPNLMLLKRSLTFSLFISLIPTGTYKNLGYVDPNMYIGYGINLEWLVNYVGYEYHATRIPLIAFIGVLIKLPTFLFGFLFKFICLSIFSISWFFTCRNFKIHNTKVHLGAFILLMSPLSISSSSWTFPNSFAVILAVTILPIVTKPIYNRKDPYLLGLMLANVGIMNVLFAVLSAVFLIPLFLGKSFSGKILTLIRIIIGGSFTWVGFEIIWKFFLKLPGSISKPQFDATFSVKGWSDEYWKPINYIFSNKPLAANFLSFLFVAIVLSSVLHFRNPSMMRFSNINSLYYSNTIFGLVIFILYFGKAYIGFSELWYFYIVIFSYFAFLIQILVSSDKFINSIVPQFLAGITIASYLKIQFHIFPNSGPIITVITTIVFFFLLQHILNFIELQKIGIPTIKQATLVIAILVSWSLLFLNPTLSYSYSGAGNSNNSKYLEDQISLIDYLESLSLEPGKVALYAGPDPSGIIGGLESTLTFHLIRLDGRNATSPQINLSKWENEHRTRLENIVILLDSKVQGARNAASVVNLEINGFCELGKHTLPNFDKQVVVLFRSAACTNEN